MGKYEEALERARKIKHGIENIGCAMAPDMLEEIFPELAESEDERIRNRIIGYLKQDIEEYPEREERLNEMIAYLEKQKEQKPNYCHHEVDETGWTEEYRKAYYDGWNNCNMQHSQLKDEQKPAEWSEEDKSKLSALLGMLTVMRKLNSNDIIVGIYSKKDREKRFKEIETWLKSLRPQPKMEWSEEDETNGWTGVDLERYLSCLQRLGTGNPQQPETVNSKWFKEHCRPQLKQEWSEEDERRFISCMGRLQTADGSPTVNSDWFEEHCYKHPSWKPSEEQMEALNRCVDYLEESDNEDADIMVELYEQLKAL